MRQNIDFNSEVNLVCYSPSDEIYLGLVAQVSRGKGIVSYPNANFSALKETWTSEQYQQNAEQASKTLRFCVKAGHYSVLEFADITFMIQTPIFVARQLMRYRHASYIERSLRYCEPQTKEWAQVIETPEEADSVYGDVVHHEEYSRSLYNELVVNGTRREWARAVLPLSVETVFLMKVNLRELLHIFEERLTPHCQKETREVVLEMYKITQHLFPTVIECWKEKNGGAPGYN